MDISFDLEKRDATLAARGLDFADAGALFDWPSITVRDDRFEYGEERWATYGMLRERLMLVIWIPTDTGIRVISMRKCNEREQTRFTARLG